MPRHRLTTLNEIRRCIFNGDSAFTLVSNRTGRAITYHARWCGEVETRNGQPYHKPLFFVRVWLDHRWRFIGTIWYGTPMAPRFKVGRRSALPDRDPAVRAMGWFIDRLRPTHPDYNTLSKVQFWEQVRPEGA